MSDKRVSVNREVLGKLMGAVEAELRRNNGKAEALRKAYEPMVRDLAWADAEVRLDKPVSMPTEDAP